MSTGDHLHVLRELTHRESERFSEPGFEPGPERLEFLREDCPVLVIGAGGLGCELLKNLALSGFTDLTVVDMDHIDVSNLNRQFLFRKKDVGRAKAEVAAEFVMERVSGCKVKSHVCKIQDFDESFYRSFRMVVAGLDNVEARRWLNAMLVGLVDVDEDGDIDPETLVPMIDGGSEGLKGHARVILPKIGPCFECTMSSFTKQVTFQMCTIAHTPRLPEHCIAWAFMLEWGKPENWGDTKLDADNPDHIRWVHERALERASEFGIQGVTFMLTKGVTKNIIPAIASTNAIVAAMCANEAVKLATYMGTFMKNYTFFNGGDGVYAYTLEYERLDDCLVCGQKEIAMDFPASAPLQEVLDGLLANEDLGLKSPSLRGDATCKKRTLYMRGHLEKQTRANLSLPLSEILPDSGKATISITDPLLPRASLALRITLTTSNSSSGTAERNACG